MTFSIRFNAPRFGNSSGDKFAQQRNIAAAAEAAQNQKRQAATTINVEAVANNWITSKQLNQTGVAGTNITYADVLIQLYDLTHQPSLGGPIKSELLSMDVDSKLCQGARKPIDELAKSGLVHSECVTSDNHPYFKYSLTPTGERVVVLLKAQGAS